MSTNPRIKVLYVNFKDFDFALGAVNNPVLEVTVRSGIVERRLASAAGFDGTILYRAPLAETLGFICVQTVEHDGSRPSVGASNSEARKRREEQESAAARPLQKDAIFFREDVERTNDDASSPAEPCDPVQWVYLDGATSLEAAGKRQPWETFKGFLRALSNAGV